MARDDAFVEAEMAETTAKRGKRISLVVGDDGRIDWDRVRPQNKEAFVSAMEGDQHTLDVLGLEPRKQAGPVELQITEEHIKTFIDLYAVGERLIVPRVIKYQTKGKVVIAPELASRVFVFTEQQKDSLAPSGAQWANDALPLWVKEWIAKIGPGAQFFGSLAMITAAQTQIVMQEWAKSQQPKQEQPINGHAVEEVIA